MHLDSHLAYNLLAPRFTPHLSHLCTHKLASLTVLRIVNQKIEPDASRQIVDALFSSPGDHVLTDVLGDQVNGVAVVHKILASPFLDPLAKQDYIETTKRVLIELKVIATQAYRRLIEEVGLPVPNFQPTYNNTLPPTGKVTKNSSQNFGVPGLPSGYPSNDQGFASMMAALQMGGQNPQAGPPAPPHCAWPVHIPFTRLVFLAICSCTPCGLVRKSFILYPLPCIIVQVSHTLYFLISADKKEHLLFDGCWLVPEQTCLFSIFLS
jgi:hypothetical protein